MAEICLCLIFLCLMNLNFFFFFTCCSIRDISQNKLSVSVCVSECMNTGKGNRKGRARAVQRVSCEAGSEQGQIREAL